MKIGAYIGVPIVLEDGQVYGTLCCFSRAADPELSESAAVKLRAISLAVAAKLQGLPNVATVLPE
jgi:GAF domain-containing protein